MNISTNTILIYGGFCLGKTLVVKVINTIISNSQLILEDKKRIKELYQIPGSVSDKQNRVEKYFSNFFHSIAEISQDSKKLYLVDQAPFSTIAYQKLVDPATNIRQKVEQDYPNYRSTISKSIIICFYSKDINADKICEYTLQRNSSIDTMVFNKRAIKERILGLNNHFKTIVDHIPLSSTRKHFICSNLDILIKARTIMNIIENSGFKVEYRLI